MPSYYCVHGTCKSDSRKNPNIRFFPFPKPITFLERATRWVELICRPGYTIDHITNNTYICELHFPGETQFFKYGEV